MSMGTKSQVLVQQRPEQKPRRRPCNREQPERTLWGARAKTHQTFMTQLDKATLPRRFNAVVQLQQLRDQFYPGSFQHRAAEHAIDLALSPGRSVSGYLANDALDNAKFILSRRDRGTPVLSLEDDDVTTASHLLSPYQDAGYSSLLKELTVRVQQLHEHGLTVLQAMRRDENVARTAQRIGCSESTVIRVRKSIREETKSILEDRGVASQ
jgi:hypothetical protein